MVLNEAPAPSFAHKTRVAELHPYNCTQQDGAATVQNLQLSLSTMQKVQEKFYSLVAKSATAARNSPHLEIFRKKGIEVLLLCERIDEWLVSHLRDFDGKQLQDV